jgi:B12-binding domain/radical SAM domain protein of rhizo-twelve system
MRVALVNPAWDFANSIYFGCRETHLPLELGYTSALLERSGHEVLLVDGPLSGLSNAALAEAVAVFGPDMTVVTTAPTYLFWRCAPPELRVPREFLDALARRGGTTVAVGPHGSATPGTTLRKLGVDLVVRGECEEVVLKLADGETPGSIPSVAGQDPGIDGSARHASRFTDLPALRWPDEWIARHHHHHHRFDAHPDVPGAEVEASRGCPYHCSFCAKIDFRDA